MEYPGFIGPAYTAQSQVLSLQACQNLYLETVESGHLKGRTVLIGTPGLEEWITLPHAPLRALWAGENRLFAVAGSKLYEVDSLGTPTLRGDVGNDNNPAQIFPNGNQIMVISNGQVWIDNGAGVTAAVFPALTGTVDTNSTTKSVTWKSGNTFSPDMVGASITINAVVYTVAHYISEHVLILTGSPGDQTGVAFSCTVQMAARTGCAIDGYFIAAPPSNKTFHISDLRNGLSWNALDFAVKEGYPDNMSCVLADHRELWLFGYESTEIWRNTGNANFPFERAEFIQHGNVAPFAATRFAGGVAWIAGEKKNARAMWARGYQPQRISTHAVEFAWRQYSTVADAIAWSYTAEGHEFLVITFPTGNATWVYDAITESWHTRSWYNGTGHDRHRASCYANVFGRHFVGDHTSGKIYILSPDHLDDDGTAIHRIRRAPHITNEQKQIFYYSLQLEMQVGAGGASDPDIYLSWSNDGGTTFGTEKVSTSGATGDYLQRVIWRRLGKARSRVFSVRITAPIHVVLVNAWIEVQPGVK